MKNKMNVIDRLVSFYDPIKASKRMRARSAMSLLNHYDGASRTRRSLKSWNTVAADANADVLPDLPTLRSRSRDLIRNNPLAAGAIKTKVTNVVGTGLKLQSRIDRQVLKFTEERARAWESSTEREWNLFWDSKDCDITRSMNGKALLRLVYRQALENGDSFTLLTQRHNKFFPYNLRLQVVEADRLENKDNAADTATLAGGIETDRDGAPRYYHVRETHPGSRHQLDNYSWKKIPAFGENLGLRNMIHLYRVDRPGQSRGVPDLACVIEPLKQLGKYTEAELMAAVISGLFTVFIESDAVDQDSLFNLDSLQNDEGEAVSTNTNDGVELGNGLIVGLEPGAKANTSNPGRPNAAFDPFTLSILRQIGVALELPFEILIKHFTASYSAARSALLEAFKYFYSEREWLIDNFLRVVYESWMFEGVFNGRIVAPGFLTDPAMRKAYLSADFIGAPKGQINPLVEIQAARERIESGTSNISIESAEMGRDWEKIHPQSVRELNARKADGLISEEKKDEELV